MALRKNLKQAAGLTLLIGAASEALVGDRTPARRHVAEALELDRGPESLASAAQALGLTGDTTEAQALADEAKGKMPRTNTLFQAINLSQALAAIALGGNAPEKSLEALKTAAPYERGKIVVPYLRGLAHLEQRRGVLGVLLHLHVLGLPSWL